MSVKMSRKFAFFYLNTGNGHRIPATVLKNEMEELHPGIDISLVNGTFNKFSSRILIENGYRLGCNYIHGAFPLCYDLGEFKISQKMVSHLVKVNYYRNLKKYIIENGITDIVSFHFVLTPMLHAIARTIPWKVNVTVYVTDPFTGPKAWFYQKHQKYMVCSEEMRKQAVEICGCREEDVVNVPFLMQKKFRTIPSAQTVEALKEKHGFDKNKKIVLLAGGGEGLPKSIEIINYCILHKVDFAIAVVCGRDKTKLKTLKLLAKANPSIDLHVFGFVNFMDELIQISDLVVSKAGASTVFELLSQKKPVILCYYIHNQELGNVRFVTNHKVGFFIRKPRSVYKKIAELLSDDKKLQHLKDNYEKTEIKTDASAIARLVYGR